MISKIFGIVAGVAALGISIFCYLKVADIPKIGVVDNAVLISNFSESITAKRKFDEQKAVWDSNVKTLEDSIKAAVDIMAKEYDKAPKQRQLEMQQNLTRRNEEYAKYTRAVQELSRKREMEALQPVLEKINSFVKNWGIEHGYDIIHGTAGGGVILTVNQKMNVTSKVLSELNALYGTGKTAPVAADTVVKTVSPKAAVAAPAGVPGENPPK